MRNVNRTGSGRRGPGSTIPHVFLTRGLPLFAALVLVPAGGCGSKGDSGSERAVATPAIAVARLDVRGMHCEDCVVSIRTTLDRFEGVLADTVSLADSLVVVHYDPKRTGEAQIGAAIEKLGFTVVTGASQAR